MLTEIESARYSRMAGQRVPIGESEVFTVCGVCGGPMRPAEPSVRYEGGARAHYFGHTCEEEIEFQGLQMKAMGIAV